MPVRISSNCRKSAKLTGTIKSSETNEIPEIEDLKVLNHCTLKMIKQLKRTRALILCLCSSKEY